jgi:hypothetical protein
MMADGGIMLCAHRSGRRLIVTFLDNAVVVFATPRPKLATIGSVYVF